MIYWILFGGIALISWLVQANLQSTFEKYSKVRLANGMTGREVAEKMLRDNGITDVKVISVTGQLTDHYNPIDKTLNLSEPVYNVCSVSAAAVAAHECGHAVQHAQSYAFLWLRSKLVPAVSFSAKWQTWVILGGMLLVGVFPYLLLAGIIMFAMTTLFSFVTLPVEFNASSRALDWLRNSGMVDYVGHDNAKSALRAAASTYVVAALSSLATLCYYVMIFLGRRD